MKRDVSLLFLTPSLVERLELVREAERAGFEVETRPSMPASTRKASDFDIVAYDWADGVPIDCVAKVERFLDSPQRTAAVVALVGARFSNERAELLEQLDDVVFPPYEPAEVIARLIRSTNRRRVSDVLMADDIRIDLAGHEVTVGGERVGLTHTEFLVLAHLVSHRGRVVTRHELARAVWGTEGVPNADALDVHVRRMRSKIRSAGADPVETVRKVGYRLAS